jgi:hypothetical protein
MRAAIVVPALDEEGTVAEVVAAVAPYGTVGVVDDGSTDRTGPVAAAAGAVVLRHDVNGGYDAALRTGFAWAAEFGFDAVVTIDADAQHDPSRIGDLLGPLARGEADAVVGARSGLPRWSERLFAAWTRRRYGLTDPLCGMKAFTLDTYRAHPASMAGRPIGTGLLLACLRSGGTVAQVAVPTRPRLGRPRFGGSVRANLLILRALARAIPASTTRPLERFSHAAR